MGMAVALFLALATTTVFYAVLGQGGAVAGLVFGAILLVGAVLRIAQTSA